MWLADIELLHWIQSYCGKILQKNKEYVCVCVCVCVCVRACICTVPYNERQHKVTRSSSRTPLKLYGNKTVCPC